MNIQGKEFVKDISEKFKKSGLKQDFNSSMITERCMRLGHEVRLYELETEKNEGIGVMTGDLERIAIATLKEDLLKDKNIIIN